MHCTCSDCVPVGSHHGSIVFSAAPLSRITSLYWAIPQQWRCCQTAFGYAFHLIPSPRGRWWDLNYYVCLCVWIVSIVQSSSLQRRATLTALHIQAVSMWSCSSSGVQLVERSSSSSRYLPYQRRLFNVCKYGMYVFSFLECMYPSCMYWIVIYLDLFFSKGFFASLYAALPTLHYWMHRN
jgi:hypothetical protein